MRWEPHKRRTVERIRSYAACGRSAGSTYIPAGKRKANELACSGDSMKPAHRLPALSAGSAPLPPTSSVTGDKFSDSSRQPGPSGGGATYAALLAGPVAPSQPSGSLKPTAMDSEPSEPSVSMETSDRRTSHYMSGPLSGRPDGTTHHAHVANACLPAGQRPNKRSIFISLVSDSHNFLAWLRATCPGGLMAQLKGEKLMVVPSTADGFRAAVSALRSLDGKDGVSFHTFTLPEDRYVRLLVKNLRRGVPKSVVWEELESLNIRVPKVSQLRSGRRDQGPAKDRPPTPNSLYQWREDVRCLRCDHSPNSAACECRWSRTWLQKAPCNVSATSDSATRSVTADTHPSASLVGAATSPVDASSRGNRLSAVAAGKTTQRTTVAV